MTVFTRMYQISQCEDKARNDNLPPPSTLLDLKCQICHEEMVAPSTPESRLYCAYLCPSHIIHVECRARMNATRCTCRAPLATTTDLSENTSLVYWRAGLRPPCGCGRATHTREEAVRCRRRQVMCLFPDCREPVFLHELEDHYSEKHPGEPVATQPKCPFPGCPDATHTLESLAEHVMSCPYKQVKCVCGLVGPLLIVR